MAAAVTVAVVAAAVADRRRPIITRVIGEGGVAVTAVTATPAAPECPRRRRRAALAIPEARRIGVGRGGHAARLAADVGVGPPARRRPPSWRCTGAR